MPHSDRPLLINQTPSDAWPAKSGYVAATKAFGVVRLRRTGARHEHETRFAYPSESPPLLQYASSIERFSVLRSNKPDPYVVCLSTPLEIKRLKTSSHVA